MKISGPAIFHRTVYCARCQSRYEVGFNSLKRAINPICLAVGKDGKECGGTKYSFLPRDEVDKLVQANLSAVWWVLKKKIMAYTPENFILAVGGEDEVAAEGRLALLEAAMHYDPTRLSVSGKAARFNTYAVVSIEQRMREWINRQLRRGAAGEPILDDRSRRYVVSVRSTVALQEINTRDGTNFDGADYDLTGCIPEPSDRANTEMMMLEVRRCIDNLDERRRTVIECLYFRGMTMRQTASLIGISRERVRQNAEEAMVLIEAMYGGVFRDMSFFNVQNLVKQRRDMKRKRKMKKRLQRQSA